MLAATLRIKPRRSSRFILKSLLVVLLFVLLLPKLYAYSSVTVSLEDPVYRYLNKLEAHGLIKTMMMGQRPYVRSEIGRLIAEALANYPEFEARYRQPSDLSVSESEKRLKEKIYVDIILDKLKVQYEQELIQWGALPGKVKTIDFHFLDYLQAQYLFLQEGIEFFPKNNGFGGIEALIQPLVESREGRHYQRGSNFGYESLHWARLGKHVALQFQPRFQSQVVPEPLEADVDFFVQRLNAHFTYKKFDIEIGRDALDWGAGPLGGLTFSANPRPLDFIKLASIHPFRFPWFFKKLGFNEMSLVLANLGPDQDFTNPWLIAYKISNRAFSSFEFSYTQIMELGGSGSPSIDLGRGIAEFFNPNGSGNFSNKGFSFDFIGRIAQWRGLKIYSEIYFSDLTSDFSELFLDNGSYLLGFYLPRLNNRGTTDLRLEFRRFSPKYARHPIFQDGLTENQRLLGDPMGPDSWSIYLGSGYQLSPKAYVGADFQFSKRLDRIFEVNGNSLDEVDFLGSENRLRYRGTWEQYWSPRIKSHLGVGMENVLASQFGKGDSELNWFGELRVTFYFHPQFLTHLSQRVY